MNLLRQPAYLRVIADDPACHLESTHQRNRQGSEILFQLPILVI